jgi:hypothetical protein
MIITTFKSIGKAYVDRRLDQDWAYQVQLLLRHHKASSKHEVPMFNLAEFKSVNDPFVERARKYHGQVVKDEQGVKTFMRDANGSYDEIPNTVRRCKGNLVGISGIVLDVDEAMTIEAAMTMLEPLEYVLYTTFRHTTEKHKFRVIIPFTRPLLAADIAGRQASIMSTFPGVDNCSFTMSQSFYFHSGNVDPIAYHNKGIILDPYDNFDYTEPKIYSVPTQEQPVSTAMTPEQASAYRDAVVASLNTCSGLHYAGKGSSNHAVLTLISICRSIGLTFQEYDAICRKIAHPESALTSEAIRVAAWTGWAGDKIRRQNRDEFIAAYGGKPIRIETPTTKFMDTTKRLKEKYNFE